ncbi:PAS domain S-box protein [Salisediminibacterium beveridgei]|uniref:Diguanylate cyclase (GGDEF domain) with PAS and metal-dependent phosphohydrolase (HAMP) domains n=1 Tax=Salisediminibacterium beveridgei TaxID=632773 RepID=A0A1D7QXJ6_9BACI|nr:PAS domain S-box protein [Salisediminibacterium beveridgei]AOM83733.1 diguanylate cyclase (GGDEF domain) with PAS and metal-dependent phosphohydrolase (HAMP) domains [Salisediminibacterium beveridgei]
MAEPVSIALITSLAAGFMLFHLHYRRKVNESLDALKKDQERFQDMAGNSRSYIWEMNMDGLHTYISPSVERVLGYKPHELIGVKMIYDMAVQEELDSVKRFTEDLLSQGKIIENMEMKQVTKNGEIVWVLVNGKPFYDLAGRQIGFRGLDTDITERKRAESSLVESEERYDSIMKISNTGVWEYDDKRKRLWCSDEYFSMLGFESGEFPNDQTNNLSEVWGELLYPTDRDPAMETFENYFKTDPTRLYENTFRMKRKDGSFAWIWSRGKILRDSEGHLTRSMVGLHIDITKMKELEAQLSLEKEQFKTTLMSIGEAVISTNRSGQVVMMNQVAEQLTGWSQQEAKGSPLVKVFHVVDEFTGEQITDIAERVMRTGESISLASGKILYSRHKNTFHIQDRATPIRNQKGIPSGVVIVFRDFSEQKKKQNEIEYLSYHDQLTGLYNRRYFEEEMKRLDKGRNLPLTLVMVDVNGLKLINDAFGHLSGDDLLRAVAEGLREVFRGDDIITRVGGDEFAVLLPRTPAEITRRRLTDLENHLYAEKVQGVSISISSGFSTKHTDDEDILEVFRRADHLMYQTKVSNRPQTRKMMIDELLQFFYNRHPEEAIHAKSVSDMADRLGKVLGLSAEDRQEIRHTALYHDIGKLAVKKEILMKSDALSPQEREELERHPEIGYSILSSISEFAAIAEYILAHHERWDGQGYPNRLQGSDIPLKARIIHVVEVYDNLTRTTAYRNKRSKDEAMEEIRLHAGKQFDPHIVERLTHDILEAETHE